MKMTFTNMLHDWYFQEAITTTMTDPELEPPAFELAIQNTSSERLDALHALLGHMQQAPSSSALTIEILDEIASGRNVSRHLAAIAGSGWELELLPLAGWWIKLQQGLLTARVAYSRPTPEDEAWIEPAVGALDNFMSAYTTGLTANGLYRQFPEQTDATRLIRLYRIYTQLVAALPGDLWPTMDWKGLRLFI